jgi:hypothetical protein
MNAPLVDSIAAVNAEARALRAAVAVGEVLHAAVGRLADDNRAPERVRRKAKRAWLAYCRGIDRALAS